MQLTLEEIKQIARGAVRVWREADGFHFCKCTEKQVAAWDAAKPILGERARTTTGVRLDFHTRSGGFSFFAAKGGKYDLLVDGQLFARVRGGEGKTHAFALPAGDMRVTLILPSHEIGVIDAVTLDDGADMRPHTYARRILFAGDSITQGWNAADDSRSFAWRVTLALDADSVINGIGGAYFRPDSVDVSGFEPDTVILAFGTNDAGHFYDLPTLVSFAEGTFAGYAAAYPKARRVAVTPIWRADEHKEFRVGVPFDTVRAAVAEAARANGFEVIDGYTLTPHDPALLADAYLHPNDAGFAAYAHNLLAVLKA